MCKSVLVQLSACGKHALCVSLGQTKAMGSVYNHKNKVIDLYGNDIEVDFRGEEVTVQNLIRLLTGRQDQDTPRSRRLNTNEKSNVLFYLTGHGGENFLKFQDDEEINAFELADAFEQMKQKKRYNELMFIVDTCQAYSMIRSAYSDGFVGFASSKVGEDSLSHHVDLDLGVYMVDRFTYHLLEFLENVSPNAARKVSELKKVCPKSQCISTPVNRFELLSADRQKNAKVTDFFGSERKMIPVSASIRPNISRAQPAQTPHQYKKPKLTSFEFAVSHSFNSENDLSLEKPSLSRLLSALVLAPLLLTFLLTFK